jgi:hypothetical protein
VLIFRVHRRAAITLRALASAVAIALVATVVVGGMSAASASISMAEPEPVALEVNATLDAAGILPGVTVERVVTLRERPDRIFNAVSLSVWAEASSALDQDRTNGLQLSVDSCDRPWHRLGDRYICSGTSVEVMAQRPVVGTTALRDLHMFNGTRTDYLRLQLSLPAEAGIDLMGQASSLSYRVASR